MRNDPTSSPIRLLALLPLLAWARPLDAATPAGTLIINTAAAQFSKGAGPPASVQSNSAVTPVAALPGLVVIKSSDPSGAVPPGTAITFRLVVESPAAFDVSNVLITDPLDPLLEPASSITTGSARNISPPGGSIPLSGTYAFARRTVEWIVPLVPAGARFEVSFTARVAPTAPDGSIIRNVTSQASSQDPNGTSSNEVLLPVVSPALSISKQTNRSRAEVGDLIGYRIAVSNVSPTLVLTGVLLRDELPPGFRYLEGSARLEGLRAADPLAGKRRGRDLIFLIGDLPLGGTRHLTYVAVPTPEAEEADGINKAWAEGSTPSGVTVSAGPAQVQVRVAGSLLSAEAVIVGRVFVDDNRNGLLDEGEAGVPAARVYLEDGTFTLTDVVGKYHIEGIRPGLHVVKVDGATLPEGVGSFASWSRSAGGAGTQFADVGADQMFKSNVATGGWGLAVSRLTARAFYRADREESLSVVEFPPLLASAVFAPDSAQISRAARTVVEGYAALIRERGGRLVSLEMVPSCYPLAEEELMRERAEKVRAELSRLVLAALPAEEDRHRAASLRSSPGATQVVPAASASSSPQALETLEAKLNEMSPDPALLSPEEGETLDSERANVELKLPPGLSPRLKLNDEVIPNDRIGLRMETSLTQVVFYRYVGVPFREGRNSLVLEGLDSAGNARAWVERIVSRVAPPRRIAVRPDDGSLKADGRTPIQVRIEVSDAQGLPVSDGTLVTLEVDSGEFIGTDASPRMEGFQALTQKGIATAHLSATSHAEERTILARADEIEGEATFSLEPDARDWILAGVGEATVGHRGMRGGATLPDALGEDGEAARLALFARGRLFGASIMTLSYDSDRERDRDQLFRKLAPDRFFPIYGDSSSQGYDVEGQGKLSLRLDQPRSSLMLGDFTTALAGGDLVRYDRALTGGAGRLEMKGFSIQSFGATTPQTQVRDELAGAGISGPYRLTRRPLVANSERIVLETRDRFHQDRVVASRAMSRFSDYDIDYEGGTLFFKQPVPFQDDDFNPILMVALYETVDGDSERTVAGGRMGYRFGEAATIGATYVSEQRDGGNFLLKGADFGIRRAFDSGSVEFRGEAATTESASNDPSGAISFHAAAKVGDSVGLTGYYRSVSSGFENPSRAGLSDVGTVRWGFEGNLKLRDSSRVKGEIFSQADSIRGQDRRVGSLDWERAFGKVTARTGLKELRALDPASGEGERARLVAAGMSLRLSQRLEGLLGRQQVVSGAALQEYPTRTSLGLTCQITGDVRAYVKEEYDQADAGDSSRTVVGLESRLTRNTVMESRYNLEDALNGARGFAQMGLRTRLPLNQDWLGDASVERVATTRGSASADFTSLGIGFEYLPARVKFTTRYELRLAEQDDTHVLTAAGATRVTGALSLFTRQRLLFILPERGGSRFDGDGLMGLAYRPVANDRLNFLVKLQGLKGHGARDAGSPDARTYLGVFEMNDQPVARLHLLGRLAVKESRDRFDGESFSSRAILWEGRGLYDITERLNAGLTLRLLDQIATGSRVTGLGVETGYRFVKDLWVVGGYNLTGFSEEGFGDRDRREAGPFLSVRFKFDEETIVGISQARARLTRKREAGEDRSGREVSPSIYPTPSE